MAGFLNVTKRSTPAKYSDLPIHEKPRAREFDEEKYVETRESFDDSDYSSSSTLPSSRETSGSYAARRPILRKPSGESQQRPKSRFRIGYRVPNRIVRYLCLALISTIILFILSLARMSINSSKRIELGHIVRPPPPPAPWESFRFLARYYGGIRTLVPFAENEPEYPRAEDEPALYNETSIEEHAASIRDIPASNSFMAYADNTTNAYLSEYAPIQECFLDEGRTISVPHLQYYQGRPRGFPNNVMGSYEVLGLPEDICFERYGRLGPYGFGYSLRAGGTGTGQFGEMEGSDAVWAHDGKIDYRTMNWGDAQRRCYQANAARFAQKSPAIEPSMTFSVLTEGKNNLELRSQPESSVSSKATVDTASTVITKKHLPRTAVVIRSWDEFVYREEDIINLRALISELSLGSGGEYDVHLLIQVRNEAEHPIWADDLTYQTHLNESVPEEFRGIATLWSETQMLMLYQGIFDTYARGPSLPVHGSYRGLQMAMQYFAHKHPEYDFFWHWEMDLRYTGHYYDLLSKVDSWTKEQPRKGLWERSSRFYVPSVHGSWEDFKQMVRVQTEMGTDSPNNMWSGLNGAKTPADRPKGDKSIWGPERPRDPQDWFEIENDPVPPTSYEKDKYAWGVGEDADLITFNPLFDPDGTTWLLSEDITGYNISEGLPPRRAAIVTCSRMSKRLLNTMHRETAFKKHHAFSEMWAPTAALQHGYKAVYFPHPMYVDREWPTEYLASVMNAGRNGASGGARTTVFGEREHNLRGMSWFYNTGFAPNLWKRWLGFKVDNEGGEEFETTVDEGRSGEGVNGMKGGEGRMCLPPMLLHPVKGVELPVEGLKEEDVEVPESDPGA